MDQKKSPVTVAASGGPSLDPKAVDKTRDILHQLSNTVSAMKIFPSEHATVKNFVGDLTQKIRSYLEAYGKLEIWVAEYSFLCGGRTVFTDETTIKSLPFFFFKDGMQALYFYQGLDRDEVLDFLDLIRKESQKPAGDGDIVTAIWERDFANIQYYAPDDFLENRIIQERAESQAASGPGAMPEFAHEVIEIKVDTTKFTTGKIELTPEDRDDVRRRSAIKELADEEAPRAALEEAPAEGTGELHRSPAAAMDPTLTEGEIQNLESLVRANRTISPDEEFLNLMVEILNLEKDLDHFNASLETLVDYHHEQLQQGNFGFSIPLVHKVRELRDYLSQTDREKSARLDAFLKKIISAKTVDAIKVLFEKKRPVDWNALVDFFKLLGQPAVPLAADLYESVPDEESRAKILDFIKTVYIQDPGGLASLVADERPLLSKGIVGLLTQSFGKKGLAHFTVFLGLKDKDVKLDAIRALGQAEDELANRILLGFLNDKDEDLRIQAAMKLNPVEETSKIQHLIGEAGTRAFKGKSLKEKQAILSFIGRTRTDEALAFLRRTLKKRALWMPTGTKEMKLAAVSGLESMGTEEAVRALEKGAESRNREVREACSQALVGLAQMKVGGA
jgi:HEAT repeat protein